MRFQTLVPPAEDSVYADRAASDLKPKSGHAEFDCADHKDFGGGNRGVTACPSHGVGSGWTVRYPEWWKDPSLLKLVIRMSEEH